MEQSEWRGRNPGVGAGEGIENVLKGIQKAYEMIRDSETRRKLANSITKLGNFMTITADAIASGRDQRAMANPETLKKAMPYPELETVTVDDEIEDEISENEEVGVKFGEEGTEEVKEDAKPDFLDLDDDGDKKESMKKAAIEEDTEGEETFHYGEDEGEDRKEEDRLEDEKDMAPHDRIREIEKHLDALKDDMDYDEDHEDRDEEHTQFESARKRTNLIIEDIKKMKQIIRPIIKNKTKI
jgi:tRNA C32,U32 (ribose-2'-O)-methylase TrmJ